MNIVKKTIATLAMGAMVSVALGGPGGLDPAHARNKSGKLEPPPVDKVKGPNPIIYALVAAVAVIGVIVLASGNDKPTSP
jgi:hypothetical protein